MSQKIKLSPGGRAEHLIFTVSAVPSCTFTYSLDRNPTAHFAMVNEPGLRAKTASLVWLTTSRT